MTVNYEEYPKVMHHPHHQPASFKRESTQGLAKGLEPGTYDAKPAILPPITVHNLQQEEEAAGRGYLPAGEGDPEAYRRAVLGVTEPEDGSFHEFPKWKYHAIEEPVIVQDAKQEKALGEGWYDNPGLAAEAAQTEEDVAPPPVVKPKRSTSRARA